MKENNAYKTISETSKLLDIPTHVLRFWEKKFSILNPKKSDGGRRYYAPSDFEILNSIKNLLYDKGYTINGAISYLQKKENNSSYNNNLNKDNREALSKLDDIFTSVEKIRKIIENY